MEARTLVEKLADSPAEVGGELFAGTLSNVGVEALVDK